jgi:Lysylphosphatidylglycerol synthase TM region
MTAATVLQRRRSAVRPLVAVTVTLAIFAVIFRRVPLPTIAAALRDVDYAPFLVLMIGNALFYFLWDTLVLAVAIGWFHAPVPYRELLPVRASSYVVGFFNTNLGRGALAAYLARRMKAPLLQLGGTVIFLVLTEYTQLVIWAMLGVAGSRANVTADLVAVAAAVAVAWLVLFLYFRLHVTPTRLARLAFAPRDWQIFRTFRLATATRYLQMVLLRAPMFVVSLCAHYYAAHAFGIHIPFLQLLAFLPAIFMVAALPVTVAHLGTTQAAWIFFFGAYAAVPQLLAFSLAAHMVFSATRAFIGIVLLPAAYFDLVPASRRRVSHAA